MSVEIELQDESRASMLLLHLTPVEVSKASAGDGMKSDMRDLADLKDQG